MTVGTDLLIQAFRLWVTDNVPASGANWPNKAEIIAALQRLAVDIGAAQAGLHTEPTIAARDTYYATPENRGNLVYVNNNNGSASDPANGVYEYVSGAARLAQGFYAGVAAVVQPLVDDAQSYAGFNLRSDALTFAPKMATGEQTTVRETDAGTHAAVAGEVRLDGTAATVGELIENEGRYTKQASGALWRTASSDRQFSTATAIASVISTDPLTAFQSEGQGVLGGTLRTNGNPPVVSGITIPATSTGQGSYTLWKEPVADYPVGTRLRFTTFLTTSDNLLSTLNFAPGVEIRGSQGNAQQVSGTTSAVQTGVNELRLRGDYIVQGSARELMGLLLQIGSTATGGSAAERFWQHRETFIEVVSSPAVKTANTISIEASRPTKDQTTYAMTAVVAPVAGTGVDFTGIATALNWTVGRSAKVMGRLKVKPGVYSTNNAVLARHVVMEADSPREARPIIQTLLPDNSSIGAIATSQALWFNDTCHARGGAVVVVRNCRYAAHSDSGNSNNRATIIWEDWSFTHLGNDGARAWQAANGGTPSAVWSAESALGMGLHSGQTVISRRTDWISPNKPFYFHDTVGWDENAYVLIEGGSIICTSNGTNNYAFDFKCLGSMRRTIVDIKGVAFNQPINIDDKTGTSTGWLNTDFDAQPANRMQITVNVWGPRSYDWTSTQTNCQCLELRGPSGSAATPFALSGSAATVLFGILPDYRVCRGGTSRTAAYSQHAITSDVNASVGLGTRLGNLTSAPLTLTIAGPVAGSITLDQDYSAMSNASVITALNAKLTAAGLTTTTFFASTPYDDIADVRHPDLEIWVKNTDTATLGRGAAVARGAKAGESKLTVSATTARQFLGIAVDDIAPGAWGRVLQPNKGGVISQSHLILAGLGTPVFGDILYISATTGALGPVAGGGNVPVLMCVETGRTSKPFTRWEFIV